MRQCVSQLLVRRTPQDATLNEAAGKYAGMDRFVARKALWADMEAQGLAIKKDPYTIRWGHRGGPLVRTPSGGANGQP